MISLTFRTYSGVFGVALLASILVISILAFGPPPVAVSASVSDKVLHAGAFFVLSFLLEGALSTTSFWRVKVPMLLSYGLFIELIQWQLPNRDFSLLDFLADGAGVVLYWVCHKPLWLMSDLIITYRSEAQD